MTSRCIIGKSDPLVLCDDLIRMTSYADTDVPHVLAESSSWLTSWGKLATAGGLGLCGAASLVIHEVCEPGACVVTLTGWVCRPRLDV